jgi:catechol 2,3-dioxygenase-like lactoylglutathione lyase family enzyme
MLKIIGLDHLVLRTTDIDAMLQFYCNVIGCVIERSLIDSIGLIQLRAGASLIDIVPVDSELGRLGGKAPDQDGRNLEHFCLTIKNMGEKELSGYLDDCGIKHLPAKERYGATGFGQSVYVEDPEGNVVELKLESAFSP